VTKSPLISKGVFENWQTRSDFGMGAANSDAVRADGACRHHDAAATGRIGPRAMTAPRGCLQSISTSLKRLARNGDVERFRAYVRSADFLNSFNGLDPDRRSSAMRTYVKAETLCEAKAPLPLVKPKRIDAKRVDKVDWSDPVMVDKLEDAYGRSGGDHERAARILGVTVGSARLAKRRHLGCSTRSSRRQNAVEAAGTALCVQGTSTRVAGRLSVTVNVNWAHHSAPHRRPRIDTAAVRIELSH
jgi:hypothetical protein